MLHRHAFVSKMLPSVLAASKLLFELLLTCEGVLSINAFLCSCVKKLTHKSTSFCILLKFIGYPGKGDKSCFCFVCRTIQVSVKSQPPALKTLRGTRFLLILAYLAYIIGVLTHLKAYA